MTYEQLEGRWRDLFSRMKWDAIKSAVKSMAGLQGKKFKVSRLWAGGRWMAGCVGGWAVGCRAVGAGEHH